MVGRWGHTIGGRNSTLSLPANTGLCSMGGRDDFFKSSCDSLELMSPTPAVSDDALASMKLVRLFLFDGLCHVLLGRLALVILLGGDCVYSMSSLSTPSCTLE